MPIPGAGSSQLCETPQVWREGHGVARDERVQTSKASVAVRELAKAVMGASDVVADDGATPTKKSLLGKIDLKSMLSKKPAAASSPA